MATAEQLVSIKGDIDGEKVITLGTGDTALAAAELMNDRHIGSIVVVDEGRVVGIFTERDVLRRIVAERRDAATITLGEVMTAPVLCAAPHTLLDELRVVMRERRVRHVPVVDGERLIGLISIGDLNRAEHEVKEATIRYLEQYVGTM